MKDFSWSPFSSCSSTNIHTLNFPLNFSPTRADSSLHIFSLLLFFYKSVEWIRNKTPACIKKWLQGNIWSSQTAPCLANIQRILLLQKCEYVMYSPVTKQYNRGYTKGAERQCGAGSYHAQAKRNNTPLMFASWFVCSVMNKKDRIRCYFVQFTDRGQCSHRPIASSALFSFSF